MTTHWTVVSDLSSAAVTPDRSRAAMAKLCRDYWPPLYRFVRWRGYSPADAQDLTQGFFTYLIEKKVYLQPERIRGRFRSFLLLLMKRYLRARLAHDSCEKRGGGKRLLGCEKRSPDDFNAVSEHEFSISAPLDEERAFESSWAASLVSNAMAALVSEYCDGAKAQVFAELRPFLTGGVSLPTHEAVAARLGVPVETVRSHLCRLRGRYRALLRAEVRRTVPREEDIDDELRYLCRVLIARS
jgi:RNA polymerase sigma-70 factor (ECF subfamily)